MTSKSLELAKRLLGKKVKIKIDRPLGSSHAKWNFTYEVNYGYVDGLMAPDGEFLDAYVLKTGKVDEYEGICVAIIHRLSDDDDKLVIVPEGETLTDEEIEKMVNFQEKWFTHKIIR
jgi:inorganic pyrophosphatase